MIDLRLGDCLEVMKTFADNSIDAIITDPPYGTTACKWDSVIDFKLMWEQLNRIIKPNGAIVLFGSEPFSSALRMSNIKNYKYDWIWKKPKGTGHLNAKRMPMNDVETISVFYIKQCTYNPQFTEGKPYKSKSGKSSFDGYGKDNRKGNDNKGKRYPKRLLEFNVVERNTVHPTQKPLPLLEYLIKTYTNENETILDFTMGSGSTGLAAKNLNRNFIGIEMDSAYFSIAENRINKSDLFSLNK
ncbi:MAG: site-specific DNA-methyltransferase (adenine-specific) [Polaribacter sp.]|jgi:site-specific DNA-methyltransferase (adenine-specific)